MAETRDEQEHQEAVDDLVIYVAGQLGIGLSQRQVADNLEASGVDYGVAARLVNQGHTIVK